MYKKLLAGFIVTILLISALASCADDNKVGGLETTSATTDTAPDETELSDDLPEANFDGYVFRIYSRNNRWFHGRITVDELDGEVLNDAIYNRNLKICQRFNIEMTEQEGQDTNIPYQSILANSDDFDMVNARCTAALQMAQEGLIVPLDKLTYINLDKPYWDKTLTGDLTFGAKKFFAVGDLNLTFYDYACIMLFNKEMHGSFNLPNPYELVKNGNWTFDKYLEMAIAVTGDLNGDGKMNGDDRYGTLGDAKFAGYSLLMATGVKSVTKDTDNMPVFSVNTDEKFINMWSETLRVLYEGGQWYDTKTGGQADEVMNAFFRSDKALFYSTTFYEIPAMRTMETDFGILPHPKYNESQADYITRIAFFDIMTIPITNPDLNRTSMIIESFTFESSKTVIPAYYDIVVSGKATRDNESVEMLDIIKNTRTLDLGDTIWSDQIRDGYLVGLISSNKTDVVSASTSRVKSVTKTIEKATEAFKN